jgi:hypothetical protein
MKEHPLQKNVSRIAIERPLDTAPNVVQGYFAPAPRIIKIPRKEAVRKQGHWPLSVGQCGILCLRWRMGGSIATIQRKCRALVHAMPDFNPATSTGQFGVIAPQT